MIPEIFLLSSTIVSSSDSTTVSQPLTHNYLPVWAVLVPFSRRGFHTSCASLFPVSGFKPQQTALPKKVPRTLGRREKRTYSLKQQVRTFFSSARRLLEDDPDSKVGLHPAGSKQWEIDLDEEGFGQGKVWRRKRKAFKERVDIRRLIGNWEEENPTQRSGIYSNERARQLGIQIEQARDQVAIRTREDPRKRQGLRGVELLKERNEQRERLRDQLIQESQELLSRLRMSQEAAEVHVSLYTEENPPPPVRAEPSTNQQGIQEFLESLRNEKELKGIGIRSRPFGSASETSQERELIEISATANPKRRLPNDEMLPPVSSPNSPMSSPSNCSVNKVPRPITLGLEKITALLAELNDPQDWLRVVHVAGTNGKGSVCAYMTSSLIASGLKVGQFTSPHLISRWDCITINNNAIPVDIFVKLEDAIKEISVTNKINASSFEILTACALTYFVHSHIDVAIIETGMGGLLDATNVFKCPLVTIITTLSFDHTAYLGTTIEAIAKHKAGIIKPQSPVVIAPQPSHIHKVIADVASEVNAPLHVALGYWRTPAQTRYIIENVRFTDSDPQSTPILGVVPGIAGSEQSVNVACAVKALSILRTSFRCITEDAVQKGIASATIPGRMEWVRFDVPEGCVPMLLDGAHNPASCAALGDYVDTIRRESPVIWIVAFSNGRDILSCMSKFVREGDSVACVSIGPVDGMEWVEPADVGITAQYARTLTQRSERVMIFGSDIAGAIRWTVKETKERRGMLVGTGSLYLVGDIHRLRRHDLQFS